MFSFQRKPRLLPVVELVLLQRPEVHVDSLVLDVTVLAISRDVAVDPFPGGHSGRDLVMTGQALLRFDGLSRLVAFDAVRGALEFGVGGGERTGSGQGLLRMTSGSGRGDGDGQCRGQERETQEKEKEYSSGSDPHSVLVLRTGPILTITIGIIVIGSGPVKGGRL
jgi:hypothetical protein